MKTPVIAIGLDAADPVLLNTWMAQGYLPNLSNFRQQGAYGSLTNLAYYKSETAWTNFATGCLPNKTGYWTPVKLNSDTYQAKEIGAYDFQEYPPFYALGDNYRVAVFDLPQVPLVKDINGIQILAWGAHSPQTPSYSQPAGLLSELQRHYGKHPALHRDHGDWWDKTYITSLQKALITGIEKRVKICRDLLNREPWDLFLTVFSEPHSASHDFWYLSQTDHPLYARGQQLNLLNNPLLQVFQSVDRAIGEILNQIPQEASVVIFSAHGNDNNTTDVTSMFFLAEFLYRFCFPGKAMIARKNLSQSVPHLITAPRRKTWTGEIWQRKEEQNLLKRFLKNQLPSKFYNHLDKLFGVTQEPDLLSPEQLRQQGNSLFWQPATWYTPFWRQMKAFAIPSYSEGYVRINLEGREPEGIVRPEDYEALCDELTHQLYQLKNARTGEAVVKTIIRTRKFASESDPKLPDADLVIDWQERPADFIEHPDFGAIGPVPYRRTGGHRNRGFLMARGSNILPGSTLEEGHGVDLAPTILALMGAPIPEYCDGKPLLS